MKRVWFYLLATAILSCGFGLAQPPSPGSSSSSSGTLRFEDGAIANGVYSNECLGFSYPIPAGWEVNGAVTGGGKAKRLSYKSLALLFLQPEKGKLPGSRILLTARDAAGEKGTAEDFVTNAVSEQLNSPTEHRELVRDTFAVYYGGKHFFRSDYKGALHDGVPLFFAYVYTEFRGYFIGATLASGTPEGLDEAAGSLHEISFQEDQANPKCSASSDGAPTSGVVDSTRVRISQGVATGLIINKVQPDYPPLARQARIQGQVVLQALIDKDGNIEKLDLVSGHPMLAPAALQAVKQWKYKPYLLNGEPVKVQTEIIVNFALSGGVDTSPSGSLPGEAMSATQLAPPGSATPQRVRITQGISAGLLIKKVQPQYPENAKQARVQGQVVLQVEISKEGTVRNLQLISGDPMLAPAAIEAVKQWIYKPYLLNGEPVAVETQVIVNFTLSVR
jgi:TonB family protein